MNKYEVLVNGIVIKSFDTFEQAKQYLINKYGTGYNMYDCGIVKGF